MASTAAPELPPDQEELPTERIAQYGGDVILDICPKDKPSRKLLVSSVFLSTASEVFAALLSSRWNEGQQPRSEDEPTTIPLPEDDPQAMFEMCSLLHLQNRGIKSLYAFAVVVDKYRCIESLRLQSKDFLHSAVQRRTGTRKPKGLTDPLLVHMVEVAGAAYLLEQDQVFAMATKAMMFRGRGDFFPIIDSNKENLHDMLPTNILPLEIKRKRAQHMLAAEIARVGRCAHCFRDFTDQKLLDRLAPDAHHAWPPDWHDMSLAAASLGLKLEAQDGIGRERRYICPDCIDEPEPEYDPRDIPKKILQLIGMIERNCTGLRLNCAKTECINLANYVCLQHGRDF